MLSEVLVRLPNGDYMHVEFYDDSSVDCAPISEEEAHDWDCGTYLVYSINSAFTSWVLIIGNDYNVVFYGRNTQGFVLASGSLDTMDVWLPNLTAPRSQIKIGWYTWPVAFGRLREDPSFVDSLRYLQDKGIFPQLPLDTVLSPAVVDNVTYRFYRSW